MNPTEIPRHLASIELKPPIELLSDEYERERNKDFVVQIVYGSSYEQDADLLATTMQKCEFTVRNAKFEDFTGIVKDLTEFIGNKQRAQNRAGVFLIVLCDGSAKAEDAGKLFSEDNPDGLTFVSIWNAFINMPALNRLPKLFLFQTHTMPTRNAFDGPPTRKRVYDVAAPGADLFLISRTTEKGQNDQFIPTFCEYIDKHGDYVDIFELATFATVENRPLILSTLTAKFYFKSARHRNYNNLILKKIGKLKESISNKS